MNDFITRHLTIHGIVQGVGYRWSMTLQAMDMGVDGWVRNCSDGSVEAVVRGPADLVHGLIAWTRQGPAEAVVLSVEVEDWAEEVESGFRQLPTT